MIDDPAKTGRLVNALEASLPIETRLPASLIRTLPARDPNAAIPARCNVVRVFYTGEEGGTLWTSAGPIPKRRTSSPLPT